MNCSDISRFRPLYLAGELEPERARSFAAHVGNCPACRRELEQDAAFDVLLRASVLAEPMDSSAVDRRVRQSIYAGRKASRRWIFAAAGVAALLLIALASYRAMYAARTRLVYAAAARDHRLEIVDGQPRKWFTDRASILRLAGSQGLPDSAVSAFMPAGYRLARGKLCLVDGRVFLHLVYAGDSGNFSLFLRRPADGAIFGIHSDTFAAEHVAGFQDGQLSALIVTEKPGDTVLNLAKSAASIL